uniref:Uncharacterized protein n=1 Tax=Salmo trutta TaxID=8032 RepID=A0A674CYF3_SALTR
MGWAMSGMTYRPINLFKHVDIRLSNEHVHHRRHHWAVFLGELSKQSYSVHNSGPAQRSHPPNKIGNEGRFPLFVNVSLKYLCLFARAKSSRLNVFSVGLQQAILLPHSAVY